jgi:hypothetical protein
LVWWENSYIWMFQWHWLLIDWDVSNNLSEFHFLSISFSLIN